MTNGDGLKLELHAAQAAKPPFAAKLYRWLLLFGILELVGLLAFNNLMSKPSLDELKKRTADTVVRNELCRMVPLCTRYAQARQACVTAGNFNRCLEIRLGSHDLGMISTCTADGKLAYAPPDAPSKVECLFRNMR